MQSKEESFFPPFCNRKIIISLNDTLSGTFPYSIVISRYVRCVGIYTPKKIRVPESKFNLDIFTTYKVLRYPGDIFGYIESEM